MIDRKGITAFLAITFVVTYAIEGALILGGLRLEGATPILGQVVVLVTMWVPTVAALLTIRFVTHESRRVLHLKLGSWKPYLISALLFPVLFAIVYGASWLLGLAQPDWQLQGFKDLFTAAGMTPPEIPSTGLVLGAILAASIIQGPFLNGFAALGEEIGWRGFLLFKLLPLGKPLAYTLVGIIWGLWHLPLILIGFVYPGQPVWGILFFVAMTTALSLYINELTVRNDSAILAAWLHGVFNSQRFSIWVLLFPTLNPLIGGYSGILGIVVWLALGLWSMRKELGLRLSPNRPRVVSG